MSPVARARVKALFELPFLDLSEAVLDDAADVLRVKAGFDGKSGEKQPLFLGCAAQDSRKIAFISGSSDPLKKPCDNRIPDIVHVDLRKDLRGLLRKGNDRAQ